MNLIFICTGNSCRSQIAEGWARAMGGDDLQVASAGLEAHGKNPRAIETMKESGVDISGQESTRLTGEMLEWADYVVTVCGHADEHCPALPPGTRKEHWPLSDPAKARGSEDMVRGIFRQARNDIRRRVQDLIDRLSSEQ